MANYKKKRIKKIKRNFSWIGVVLFCIFFAIAGVITVALADVFLSMFIKNKADGGFAFAKYMAGVYESAVDKEDVYETLDKADRAYVIKDKKGNVIHEHGKITAANKGEEVRDKLMMTGTLGTVSINGLVSEDADGNIDRAYYVIDEDGQITATSVDTNSTEEMTSDSGDKTYLYSDTEAQYITTYGGEVSIDLLLFYHDYVSKPFNEVFTDRDSIVSLPYWIGYDVDGGDNLFIVQSFVNIELSDITYILIAIGLIILIAGLLFFTMVISTIVNAVNNRRAVNLLFTDMVTKGRNWLWFVYRGTPFLAKGSTAKNNYAVVNLVFVKYRNYCMCHSLEQGEIVLKRVHDRLKRLVNKKEMVVHVSNSNFALLLKYNDKEELNARLNSIINDLSSVDTAHSFKFQAGVDLVGVYKNEKGRVVKRKDIDIEREYNNACEARTTLKGSDDSGIAYFDQKMIDDQKWIDTVTERQGYAISNEEFKVYYQPKYDPVTDTLKGAEALIRWINDDMGFVPPGKFIPIFEKNGFITSIDHYMLEHVAKDQKEWLDQGKNLVPVSVNFSRAHFAESDLAEQIRDSVDKIGTPHKYIEIELTESAFFDDKKALISTITRLREYGFAVSMDDFGSGYSSLNSLKDMPLDVLKLDAEFFRGENAGERGEIVVAEAIKLAKSLNMRTVAEGVEIKEQVDFLAAQGCDMIQGYYYAKPMVKEDYEGAMEAE